MNSAEVRQNLADALVLDLIGPDERLGSAQEILPQAPSRWYLTGFIVPLDAETSQRADEDATEEVDAANDGGGSDDATTPEPASARRRYLPSSIGLSVLVSAESETIRVVARWGDYKCKNPEARETEQEWERQPRQEEIAVKLPAGTDSPRECNVPKSAGLKIVYSVRAVISENGEGDLPAGTRCVSIFLVNRRVPMADVIRDEAFVFQAEIEARSDIEFVPRPNLRSMESDDWDERVADLQYRDVCEFAVGHNVATRATLTGRGCRSVRTCWIPQSEVERVAPAQMSGVELSMDVLGRLSDGADASAKLGQIVTQYRVWID